jgi:Ca-activated chloride channel family protein
MNRTGIFLAAAGVLALVAVVAGTPRLAPPRGSPPTPSVEPPPRTVGRGTLSITARLSHPLVGLGQQDVFTTVDVKAVELPGSRRSPVNLALVIDRSGSMSGFKLNQAKQAARQLVSQLSADDRLAIVHYGSDVKSMAGLVATPANKEKLLAYIDGIWDDGGTNIGSALAAARDLLLGSREGFTVNRAILISDGQPTEGVTEPEALLAIARELRSSGVSLSSIGVGEDYNERLMEGFAEVGAGAYAYLQDASQLGVIFQKDLNAAGTQVASGVTLTFRVPRGVSFQRVFGYTQVSTQRDGDATLVTVALPDFAAGQQERVVVHLTVSATTAGESVDVSALDLSYRDVLASAAVRDEARVTALATDQPQLVLERRDKDAIVFAARARAAQNAAEAAASIAKGDRDGARRALQRNKVLFDEAGDVAGYGAVAGDQKTQAAFEAELDEARDEGSRRVLQKRISTQARKDYGLMGSTY